MVVVAIIMILRPPPLPALLPLFPYFPLFHIISPHPWKVGDTRQYQHIFSTIFDQPKYGKDSGNYVTNKENKCQKLWSCVVFAPESFIRSNFIFFILWFYFQAKSCKIYEKMESGNFQSLFLKLARPSTSKSLTNQVCFVLLAMVSWDGLVYACQLESKTFYRQVPRLTPSKWVGGDILIFLT